MTPEFKAAWVAALRSGEYQQGKLALLEGDKFCCLGVACNLIDAEGWEDRQGSFGMGWHGRAPESLELPFIDILDAEVLSNMNDIQGMSFKEIADYIEDYVI